MNQLVVLACLLSALQVLSQSHILSIKWITSEHLKKEPTVVLNESLSWAQDKLNCTWYKLGDNIPLLRGVDDLYVTTQTKDACALEITYEHNYQIDYYKLNYHGAKVGVSYAEREPTYALLYVDSFKIVKVKKNNDVYTYNCQLEILMPSLDSHLQLDERLKKLLDESVRIDAQPLNNSQASSFLLTNQNKGHLKRRDVFISKKRLSVLHEFNVRADKDNSLVCYLVLNEGTNNIVFRMEIFKHFKDYKQVEDFQTLTSNHNRSNRSTECNNILAFVLVLVLKKLLL